MSRHLCNKFDIRQLALELGLKSQNVDSIFENNKNDINEAAYRVLQKWLYMENNRKDAYVKLQEALRTCQMSMIAGDVLKEGVIGE